MPDPRAIFARRVDANRDRGRRSQTADNPATSEACIRYASDMVLMRITSHRANVGPTRVVPKDFHSHLNLAGLAEGNAGSATAAIDTSKSAASMARFRRRVFFGDISFEHLFQMPPRNVRPIHLPDWHGQNGNRGNNREGLCSSGGNTGLHACRVRTNDQSGDPRGSNRRGEWTVSRRCSDHIGQLFNPVRSIPGVHRAIGFHTAASQKPRRLPGAFSFQVCRRSAISNRRMHSAPASLLYGLQIIDQRQDAALHNLRHVTCA